MISALKRLARMLNNAAGLPWKYDPISTGVVLGLAEGRSRWPGLVRNVMTATGAPYKIALAAVMREVNRGYLDFYPKTPEDAWLTAKGRAALLRERTEVE